MSANTNTLMRLEVKYIRDGIKAKYPVKISCRICGTTDELENHHYHTVTLLWNQFKKNNQIVIKDADHIMAVRNDFYEQYMEKLVSPEEVVCLCNTHHLKLHSIYGKDPALSTAEKQKRWVGIQRGKHGLESESTSRTE